MSRFFVDVWGRLWFKLNDYEVWSDESGYGGWYNGQGLTALPADYRLAP